MTHGGVGAGYRNGGQLGRLYAASSADPRRQCWRGLSEQSADFGLPQGNAPNQEPIGHVVLLRWKRAYSPLHGFYNADRSCKILDEADSRSMPIDAATVLVFDDFITRGDTLSCTAQGILRVTRR